MTHRTTVPTATTLCLTSGNRFVGGIVTLGLDYILTDMGGVAMPGHPSKHVGGSPPLLVGKDPPLARVGGILGESTTA